MREFNQNLNDKIANALRKFLPKQEEQSDDKKKPESVQIEIQRVGEALNGKIIAARSKQEETELRNVLGV